MPDRQSLAETVAGFAHHANEFSLFADRHDLQAASVADLDHPFGLAAIGIDHGRRAFGQQLVEQPELGQKILLGVLVVVEMIVAEVEERARRQPHAIEPPLVKAVAGGFHRQMLDAVLRQLRQHGVQRHRVGRGEAVGGRAVGADEAKRAEIGGLQTQPGPDLAHEIGRGRLAACSGDGDDGLRLVAIKSGRHLGQGEARIARAHHGDLGAA